MWEIHAEPPQNDDGLIAGSLVGLLDADDIPPAPQAPPDPHIADRPEVVQMPPPANPDINIAINLQQIINQRNTTVDRCDLFPLIEQYVEAEQRFFAARRIAHAANGMVHAKAQAVHMAAAQNNSGLVAQANGQLAAAQRQAQKANTDVQNAKKKVYDLGNQVFPNIQALIGFYRQMRGFVIHDRRDPNLPVVHATFQSAVGGRKDFHEGRVLAALCEIYNGNAGSAEQHLQNNLFANQHFFDWPMANDICLAYLLLDQPQHVVMWIKWARKIDENRKTPARCWMVALQAAIERKDNAAAEWFTRCERKLGAAAKKAEHLIVMPPTVAGDYSLFLLTCPNQKLRNIEKAQELLAAIPPENACWQSMRADGALAAERGNWQQAVNKLEECLDHAPGVLDAELQAQLAEYQARRLWERPRPKLAGK